MASWTGFLILFAVVALGAIVPVVPTGAAVSAAAVLARGEHPWELVLVVLCGAAGAYFGDVVVYAALRVLGESFAQRIGWLQRDNPQAALARLRQGIEERELRTMLIARLVPAGRGPFLLAAALGGYPWRRFAVAAVVSTLVWAMAYSAIGILGETIFPDQKVALVFVVATAILLTLVLSGVQRLRDRSDRGPDA